MSTPELSLNIDIAGGGASATLVLAHLSNHKNAGKIERITIWDREGRFARGVAYNTENPLHLLNVRANNMSGFPDDKSHFIHWLAVNNHAYKDTDFVPRMLYARYLKNLWDNAIANLESLGCEIILKTEGFDKGAAPIKIIATGNAFPFSPRGADQLTSTDGYHANPWNVDYQSLKEHIAIAGTGLSMVDTIMALESASFEGQVTAISRHGFLPTAHVAPSAYPCFYQEENFPKTSLQLLTDMRAHVKNAKEQGIPWQPVIDSLRPVTNQIWLSLREAEKKKLKRLNTLWNIHRHRMAPEAARIIKKWKKAEKLIIVKDRIEHVEKGINIAGRKATYKVRYMINCLGYGSDPGFKYDFGQEKSGIFALGPALSGLYPETTAMPEIRAQAERIAHEILK